jgi:Na+/proline symporter
MAMVMSTADSYVNSTSVLIVHDFCKPLKISFIRNELNFSRLVSLFIGMFSMLLAMRSGSLLELFMFTSSFYMPVVTVPFIMSIFGFRSVECNQVLTPLRQKL